MPKPIEKDIEPKEEGPRSFARILEHLNDGEAHADLSKELFDLVKKLSLEARNRGAEVRGELNLKIGLKVNEYGRATTTYEVKSKTPPRKTSAGVMYTTKGGNLSVSDERQPVLPGIRAVGPARELDDDHAPAKEA